MNGDVFVLDSNFILDYLKDRPGHVAFMREHVRHALWTSVITEMELYSFPGITDGEKSVLDSFMALVRIAPLDGRVKDIAIPFGAPPAARSPTPLSPPRRSGLTPPL